MLESSEQSMLPEESQVQRNVLSSGIQDFHTQERERMFNPGISYTYHLKDFSVTVGPIRAPGGTLSTTPCKGKSHPLLVSDRPAFITIIVIVRDAVARWPNLIQMILMQKIELKEKMLQRWSWYRPRFLDIFSLLYRLRNGEGTRQHICELVKESQFINQVYLQFFRMLFYQS